ncbi:MAG: hypothetical protein ACI87E_003403 [Mariniblastus sp.]|jgi:hypothetical protein
MKDILNIYCDESCHLDKDESSVMTLGAVSCPTSHARKLSLKVRELKRKHGLSDSFEIKWVKVSPGKQDFYLELLDLFFVDEHLSFRGLVIPNKEILRHEEFDQTHDQWYYKMYYLLLRPIVAGGIPCRAFLDIKDTRGGRRVRELERYLKSGPGEFDGDVLRGLQQAHSKELTAMQLADLLIGALGYFHRQLTSGSAKLALIERIKERTSLTLKWSTAPGRKKFDIFVWEASRGDVS